MHLAQILNDAHILDLSALILHLTEKFSISLDKPSNEKLDHLSCHEQWDWNERVQQLEVPDESEEAFDYAWVAELNVEVHWFVLICLAFFRGFTVPESALNGYGEC